MCVFREEERSEDEKDENEEGAEVKWECGDEKTIGG